MTFSNRMKHITGSATIGWIVACIVWGIYPHEDFVVSSMYLGLVMGIYAALLSRFRMASFMVTVFASMGLGLLLGGVTREISEWLYLSPLWIAGLGAAIWFVGGIVLACVPYFARRRMPGE